MSVWKTLSSTVLLSRKPFVEVIQDHVLTDRNQVVKDFYRVEFAPFAVCVPVLPDGRFLTLRSYKHGAGQVCTQFPGGHLDEGEMPDTAIARELLEETGYQAGRMVPLGKFIDNGNRVGGRGHYYVAVDCVQIQAPDDGDLEVIEPGITTAAQIEQAIAAGDMPVIHHVAAWYLARAWQARQTDAPGGPCLDVAN